MFRLGLNKEQTKRGRIALFLKPKTKTEIFKLEIDLELFNIQSYTHGKNLQCHGQVINERPEPLRSGGCRAQRSLS